MCVLLSFPGRKKGTRRRTFLFQVFSRKKNARAREIKKKKTWISLVTFWAHARAESHISESSLSKKKTNLFYPFFFFSFFLFFLFYHSFCFSRSEEEKRTRFVDLYLRERFSSPRPREKRVQWQMNEWKGGQRGFEHEEFWLARASFFPFFGFFSFCRPVVAFLLSSSREEEEIDEDKTPRSTKTSPRVSCSGETLKHLFLYFCLKP